MDKREIGLFLLGFGIASLVAFSIIYFQLSPMEADLASAQPDVQAIYDVTHGDNYGDLVATSTTLTSIAKQLASIPLIGDAINSAEISKFADSSNSLLINSRSASEKVLPAIKNTLFAIQTSFYGMILSIFLVVAGFWLIRK